jgi:hypothetical protein
LQEHGSLINANEVMTTAQNVFANRTASTAAKIQYQGRSDDVGQKGIQKLLF